LASTGVINVLLIVIVSIYTLATNFQNIPEGISMVESGAVEVVSAGHSPITSGLAYHGVLLCISVHL
jgi:hypothetical protein